MTEFRKFDTYQKRATKIILDIAVQNLRNLPSPQAAAENTVKILADTKKIFPQFSRRTKEMLTALRRETLTRSIRKSGEEKTN